MTTFDPQPPEDADSPASTPMESSRVVDLNELSEVDLEKLFMATDD